MIPGNTSNVTLLKVTLLKVLQDLNEAWSNSTAKQTFRH